jgi:hypothetical protein
MTAMLIVFKITGFGHFSFWWFIPSIIWDTVSMTLSPGK